MANMMREHVPQQTRIHYVITDGGAAPNVVPASASVYYYVRHPEPGVVRDVFARLQAAADGAAQGTGTSVVFEQSGGVLDRKSVVSGKSVSVRVDLGGCRNIQKKTKRKN